MSFAYNMIFKRTSTFTLAAITCAFFFERAFDLGSETIFEKYNAGKLYKDMKQDE